MRFLLVIANWLQKFVVAVVVIVGDNGMSDVKDDGEGGVIGGWGRGRSTGMGRGGAVNGCRECR